MNVASGTTVDGGEVGFTEGMKTAVTIHGRVGHRHSVRVITVPGERTRVVVGSFANESVRNAGDEDRRIRQIVRRDVGRGAAV